MSNLDTFLTIQPKKTNLKKYISYYYFHQSTDSKFKKTFTFFPNYIHGLTAYRNSNIHINEKGSDVTPINNEEIKVYYTMNYDKAIEVSLHGVFNKIGIAFQFAGINHFIDSDLNKLYHENTYEFTHFGLEFEKILAGIFHLENLEEKRDLLDDFFVSHLKTFENQKLIECLEEIIESNGTIKVNALEEKTGIQRKTLLRNFQKHFCCSIEEYKKMVKFRNTLNYSQSLSEFNSLTEISLYNHYYDQSDFNKQFKSITNYTPKELLSKIKKIGEEETYWVFE